VAVVIASYVRALGWSARGHAAVDPLADEHVESQVDIERLAQRAGVAKSVDGVLAMPFSKRGFRLGVVTTDYPLEVDLPIAADASLDWPDESAYVGTAGTRPGFEDAELALRPVHMGRYPMEQIRRVEQPTTLILRDEIQRVPKRADLFTRALAGDLGERPKKKRTRFAVKHPLACATPPIIRNMVPLQGTREPLDLHEPLHLHEPHEPRESLVSTGFGGDLSDPQRYSDVIKALG